MKTSGKNKAKRDAKDSTERSMVVLTDDRCDNISVECLFQYLNKVAVIVYYLVSKCQNNTCHYFFTFRLPCIVTNFFVIKPTRCTNFTNLFCHETLHVSDSSFAHHQEFIHCTLSNGICHTGM